MLQMVIYIDFKKWLQNPTWYDTGILLPILSVLMSITQVEHAPRIWMSAGPDPALMGAPALIWSMTTFVSVHSVSKDQHFVPKQQIHPEQKAVVLHRVWFKELDV